MMKKTISLISVLFFIIALIVFINNKTREKWEQADKIYAIAHVTGKLSGTGPARDKYSYKINNTSYFGADYHLMQGSYYIIEVDRKSTRLNSSHVRISYAVFCLKKKI